MLKFIVMVVLLTSHVTGMIKLPGNIIVIGLFQIYEPEDGKCSQNVKISSVMTAEAVKWYFQRFNKQNGGPFKIGFEAYETCRLTSKAAEVVINIMNRSINRTSNSDYIAGIIGPEFSSEVEVTSPILSAVSEDKRLPQVGFSTTAAGLRDKTKYPNFVRVVPNDDIQIETMVQTMIQLEWNRIAILHENDPYGNGASNNLQIRAIKHKICISFIAKIDVKGGTDVRQINSFLRTITASDDASRPIIQGFIYIGTSTTASLVLSTLDGMSTQFKPIAMLSDGGMDLNVYKKVPDTIISSAKGSLTFGPVYREITEFTNHWREIFTNASVFQTEFATNSWLQDVNRTCAENCKSSMTFQPVYVQYGMIAAHAMATAINMLKTKHCQNSSEICDKITPKELLSTLHGMNVTLNFTSGYANDSSFIRINDSGEVDTQQGEPLYQVYNLQQNGTRQNFELVHVGSYSEGITSLHIDKIRDYDNEGVEKRWPDLRKAQCMAPSKCTECIPLSSIQESFLFEEGDTYVIGTVQVFESSSTTNCGNIGIFNGYEVVEALKFAVHEINSKMLGKAGIFPNMTIGLIVLNSCNTPTVIQRKILGMIENGLTLNNGTHVDLNGSIIGFLGDVSSSTSIGVAEILTRLKRVQMSFASTTPLLSDRQKYPLFMRVVTPDDVQAKAIVSIVQELDSNYIQVIHINDTYGDGLKDKIKQVASENNICVIQTLAVRTNDNFLTYLEGLRKFPSAKIVVIILQPNMVSDFVAKITSQMKNGEFVFIGSEAWTKNPAILAGDTEQKLKGSYILSMEMYEDKAFADYLHTITIDAASVNSWKHMYLETKGNCYYNFSFDKSRENMCEAHTNLEADSWTTTAYVAAKTMLRGAYSLFKAKCGISETRLCKQFLDNPKELYNAILNVTENIDGSGIPSPVFDKNGDGNVGYKIFNIQDVPGKPLKLQYVEVGKYQIGKPLEFHKDKVPPNNEFIQSRCPNEPSCGSCFKPLQKTSEEQSKKQSNDAAVITLGTLFGVAVLLLAILTFVCTKRKSFTKESPYDTYLTPVQAEVGYVKSERQDVASYINSNDICTDVIPPCSSSTMSNGLTKV